MLARFRYRAMGIISQHPSDNDPARWLFLMQHYGLPTRLLDWSESALAALFFALVDKPDVDGRLFMLAPMAFNKQQVGERVLLPPTISPVVDIMFASFKASEQPPKIVATVPYMSNERLARQRGGFTIHGIPDDLCSMASKDILRSIVIPAKFKRGLLDTLAHLGITRTSLFNDLDALSTELREQYGIS